MDKEELYARTAFGKQVDQFYSSAVGSYLRERAREECGTALMALKSCDPTDSKLVARLQGEVWRSESFENWLGEAILDGLKSLELIESGDLDDSQ